MVQQQQRLFRCIATLEPHDQIGLASGSTFIEVGHEAVAFQLGLDQRRRFAGVGGRINGSNAKVLLEEFEGVSFNCGQSGSAARAREDEKRRHRRTTPTRA